MENKQIRPLTPTERQYATENYHLISKFLILSKLDAEEFFDRPGGRRPGHDI